MMIGRTHKTSGGSETPPKAIIARWRVALSWLALAWEELWPLLWPAAGLAGLWIFLGLLDVLPLLPGWVHAGLLTAFAAGVAALLWLRLRAWRLPQRRGALRRIERVNELPHRPLQSLEDQLLAGRNDGEARRLWQRYQARLRRTAQRLRVGWPHSSLIRHDPYALRIALGLALIMSLAAAGSDSPARIARAMSPDLSGLASGMPARLDAWITPPAYTQRPPVFLTAADGSGGVAVESPVTVPEGSTLVARVTGGSGTPTVMAGEDPTDFVEEDGAGFRHESLLAESGRVTVAQSGRDLGAWDIKVLPDSPPSVSFVRKPSATARRSLRVDVTAGDDYGVTKVVATITRSGTVAEGAALAKLPPIVQALPLTGPDPKTVRSTSFHDLTPHPWAGLPVNIRLTAHDAAGQTGRSKSIELVLPERVFTHPVARAIIGQRKLLALYPERNRQRVGASLEVLAWEYESYREDVVVFLALTAVSRRLGRNNLKTPEAFAEVLDVLWNTALRVEDGMLSLSERALREAQQALMDALSKNANDKEIESLLRDVERALNSYFDALAEMMRNMPQQRAEQMPQMDPEALRMNRGDFQKLLDQIRELSRSGQKDAAKQLLSQLRGLLESLRMRRFAQPNQQQQRAMKMLNDLQGLIRDQQKLLDKTFREAQRRGQLQGDQPLRRFPRRLFPRQSRPQDGAGAQPMPMPGESAQQEALRRRLGEMMRKFGEMSGSIPRPLGRAERSMRDATGKLGQGEAGQAVPPQSQAIDQLQQGARAATQQLMRQLGRSGMVGRQPDGEQPGQQRDPFGRDPNSAGQGASTGDVEVPDQDRVRAARRLRDELRRRAGQRTRPKPERDYIQRLLKEF
jgi:uncharacterized protein (TIGR02302 family)